MTSSLEYMEAIRDEIQHRGNRAINKLSKSMDHLKSQRKASKLELTHSMFCQSMR